MSSADEVARDLMALGARAGARAFAIVRHHGQLLETRVKAHASGRPGPRAVTGDYRRDINLQMTLKPGEVVGNVSTSKPQGRRLELGFMNMTDSLGRTFHQPPYPHFGPALDETEPGFVDEIATITDER